MAVGKVIMASSRTGSDFGIPLAITDDGNGFRSRVGLVRENGITGCPWWTWRVSADIWGKLPNSASADESEEAGGGPGCISILKSEELLASKRLCMFGKEGAIVSSGSSVFAN